MISIKTIRNEVLKLFPAFGLQLQINNTLFESTTAPAEMVFPIEIPHQDYNSQIIYDLRQGDIAASAYFYNAKIFEANVELIDYDKEKATINLKSGFANASVMKMTLPQIYAEIINVGNSGSTADIIAWMKYVNTQSWPAITHAFPPLKNAGAYGDRNTDFLGVINSWDRAAQSFHYNVLAYSGQNKYAAQPFIYLFEVLKRGFALADLTMDGDFANDAEMQTLLLDNNQSIEKFEDHTAVANTSAAHSLYTDHVSLYPRIEFDNELSDPDNQFNPSLYEYNCYGTDYFETEVNITFEIPTQTGVTNVRFQIGIGSNGAAVDANHPTGFPLNTPITVTRTINTLTGLAGDKVWCRLFGIAYPTYGTGTVQINSASIRITPIKKSTLNIFNPDINTTQHLPNVTFEELLECVKKIGVNITFNLNERKVYLDYITTALNARSLLDLTHACDKNEVRIKEDDQKLKHVAFQIPSDDKVFETTPLKVYPTSMGGSITDFPKFADLPAPSRVGDIVRVNNEMAFYEGYDNAGTLEWRLYSYDVIPLVFNADGEEWMNQACPVMMTRFDMNAEGEILMPVKDQLLTSSVFRTEAEQSKTIRLFFNRGMQTSTAGDYLLASPTNYDNDGVAIADYRLRYGDTYNSVPGDLHFEFFADFFSKILFGDTIRKTFTLDIIDLRNVFNNSIIYYHGQLRMIKKWNLPIESGKEYIEEAEAEMVDINPLHF